MWPDLKLPSPKCTQSCSQNRKGDYQKVNEEKRDARPEKRDQTDGSNHTVDVHPKSVISFKEYKDQKEAEQKALAADKSIPEEEDWDVDPPLPPQKTPPGAGSMPPSQEDEWKWMIDQDPHSQSIAGDSGHGKMTVSMEETEELTGTVGRD